MPVITLLLAAIYLLTIYCLLLLAQHTIKWLSTPRRDVG